MTKFRNPYHFVPIPATPPPEAVPLAAFDPRRAKPGEVVEPAAKQAPHVTHDRFVPGTHSGRIVCRLTVETPLLCANEQRERDDERWTKQLLPFELEGEPAIPGSSLRGMLSSQLETASHSALRVLEDRHMSYRRPVGGGLSALGLVVAGPDGKLHLYPLASPHHDQQEHIDLPKDGISNYGVMFPSRRAKVYFGEKPTIGKGWFLGRYRSNSSPTGGPYYAVRSAALADKVKGNRYWLGETLQPAPFDQAGLEQAVRLWDELSEQERASGQWIRGILRVLGRYPERETELPTKKHEFFLPFSEDDERSVRTFRGIYPITTEALARFEELADERAEKENEGQTDPRKLVPFTPHGMNRGIPSGRRPATSWQLEPGDVVFFRPSSDGKSVVEVALSSVWRGRVEQKSPQLSARAPLLSFLPHRELGPLVEGREHLTLAEQLLGAVEVRHESGAASSGQKQQAFALASRLRVGHGRLSSAPGDQPYQPASALLSEAQRRALNGPNAPPDVPLQNLASPKPPSPALYFKPKTGAGYIQKSRLNPNEHTLQGRKQYLRREPSRFLASASEVFVHSDRLTDPTPNVRPAIARQHQSAEKLVRPGTVFFFHLDFYNLSNLELALLVYCLAPSVRFRHQLGHGKPLGLGQVNIELAALLEVEHSLRYGSDDLAADRWHRAWTGIEREEIPARLISGLPLAALPLAKDPPALRKDLEAWASSPDVRLTPYLRALELVGSPPTDGVPVHYPQADRVQEGHGQQAHWVEIHAGTRQFEEEHYAWFVQNDQLIQGRTRGQHLPPLVDANRNVATSIPTLERAQTPPLPGGGGGQQGGGQHGGGHHGGGHHAGGHHGGQHHGGGHQAANHQANGSPPIPAEGFPGQTIRCRLSKETTRKGGPVFYTVGGGKKCVLHPRSASLPSTLATDQEVDLVLRATGETWQVAWEPPAGS